MRELFDLKGKVAMVTGASRGIGAGLAKGLAAHGASVAIIARTNDQLETVAAEIRQATWQRVLPVAADVTSDADRRRLVETVESELGPIDILVNNAGTTYRAPAHEMPLEEYDRQMDVNVRSVYALSQLVGGRMVERRRGSVIMISSLMAQMSRPTTSVYTASKGAIKQLTKGLAADWAPHGVRVNAIGPGYIATPLTQPMRDDPRLNEWVLSRTPMARWGTPDDLVGAAVFLASDASAFMTGQSIYVDGGFLIGS